MSEAIQLRSDTSTNWTSHNPILRVAEYGYETDTQQGKYGDGVTAWLLLRYSSYLLPKTVASNYTLLPSDQYLRINSPTALVTVTLPAATGTGLVLIIKNVNAATATVTAQGSDLVDGASSVPLTQYQATKLLDGAAGHWDKL